MQVPTPLRTRHVRYRSDVLVITAAGDIDLSTAPQFADALATDTPVTVVDLTGVTFLAVTGLRLLIDAADLATARGDRFGIVAHDRTALRLLRMGQAGIPVYPSLADAIRELALPADTASLAPAE